MRCALMMMRLCAACRNTSVRRTTGTAPAEMTSASTWPGPTEESWSKCVAEVLGLRPTTTASHVRNLREAHLLTKTGRGITGAHMTARDAAHLLIAATCSQDVQDSVDTVHRYGKLTHGGNAVREGAFPALAALGEQHSFADVLATLLDGPSIQFLADDPKSTVFVTFEHPIPEVLLE